MAWRFIEGDKGHGRLSEIPYWRLVLFGIAVLLVSGTSLTDQIVVRGALVLGAIILMAYAFVRDAKAERSMFPRQATLINTELGATYWVIFFVSICLTFVNTYTTFYLQTLHGVSPFAAGYIYAIQSFMWTASALLVATVPASRESLAVVIGLAVLVISAFGISYTVEAGPVIGLAIAIGLSGAGIGLMNNPAIQRAMAVAPESEQHIAGTSVQTMRNIGISFGAGLSGMAASAGGLTDGAGRDVIALSMRWVYAVNIVFAVLGLVVALMLLLRHRRSSEILKAGV
jgi:MFS family permease